MGTVGRIGGLHMTVGHFLCARSLQDSPGDTVEGNKAVPCRFRPGGARAKRCSQCAAQLSGWRQGAGCGRRVAVGSLK
eukprot:1575509-Rhodomonas_salina.1